jgi:uncharacterized protein
MEKWLQKIGRYNLWDGKQPNQGFLRATYLEKISGYIGNKLVKVIVGQRRSGKSYLLRQIMNYLHEVKNVNPKNIFYLNKEYIAFDEITTDSDLELLYRQYLATFEVTGKKWIFLDEVQNIKDWEKFVNSYAQDFTDEYELFVTGSNSKLLSGELATLLSGRYVEFEVLPFGLREMAMARESEVNREFFIDYLKTGGLPEILTLHDEEVRRHYVEDLINTIILRDIAMRSQINDIALLKEVFSFLSVNIGSYTSIGSIVKYFKSRQKKTNYETLSTYIGHLLDAFIVHEAKRFNIRGKQNLGGERKYYLNDLAFKNQTFGIFPEDMGYNLENYVYLELRRLGYHVSVGVMNNKEIDFVAEKHGKTIYIQVAYLLANKETVEREFGNLLAIDDNFEKLVVSLDETKFSDFKGIRHIWPWELGN